MSNICLELRLNIEIMSPYKRVGREHNAPLRTTLAYFPNLLYIHTNLTFK